MPNIPKAEFAMSATTMNMVGSTCNVERIDTDGAAWVAIWWNGDEGTVLTQIGLAPRQMEKMAD